MQADWLNSEFYTKPAFSYLLLAQDFKQHLHNSAFQDNIQLLLMSMSSQLKTGSTYLNEILSKLDK